MIPLKSAGAVNDMAINTPPGCAGLSGGGPAAFECRDCAHWGANRAKRPKPSENGRCAKFFEITGKKGAAVRASTPSCRYFMAFNAPWVGKADLTWPEPVQSTMFGGAE